MAVETGPLTIFDSDDMQDDALGGYEVAVSLGADGKIETVAIMDHENSEMIEAPIRAALAIAKAILDQVPDPSKLLN